MIDETTDCSNSEQVVICCRWVDSSLEAHEEFMGLYQVGSIKASALVHVIKDFLLRSNFSIQSKLRGQCYDGASSMCGSKNGVATQIAKEPRALYTHCYGHSLNLACSDTIKQSKIIRNSLDSVLESKEISTARVNFTRFKAKTFCGVTRYSCFVPYQMDRVCRHFTKHCYEL